MPSVAINQSGVAKWLSRALLAVVVLVFLLPFLQIDRIDSSSAEGFEGGGEANRTICAAGECPAGGNCEARASWGVVMTLNTLTLSILLIYLLLVSHLHFIPESVVVILLGCVLGSVLEAIDRKFTDLFNFDPESFFLYLLPAIIFESGHSLNKDVFFENLGSILTFAIAGTLISTLVVGTGLSTLGSMGIIYNIGTMDSLSFAALISAVDPVATLAIFQALKVDPLLHYLVFGESVLNDVVSIALYKTCVEIKRTHKHLSMMVFLKITAQFVYVSSASVMIGVVISATAALLFKYFSFRAYPALEMSLVFIFSYLPYLICEGLGLSGLFAIFFGGITNSHYMNYNLSPTTLIATKQVFQMLAFMAETLMFAYLGMAVFSFKHIFSQSLVLATLVLIFVGRAMNVFPLSFLLNIFRSITIEWNYQIIMWFSGLRGAVAFALALSFEGENNQIIVTTTLTTVIFTILFMGVGTTPLLKVFKIPYGNAIHMIKAESPSGQIIGNTQQAGTKSQQNWFTRIDNMFIIPFLRLNYLPPEENRAVELQSIMTKRKDFMTTLSSLTPSAAVWKTIPNGKIQSVSVCGVPTDVIVFRSLLRGSNPSPLKIVFIPGNPGVLDYYVPYLRQLHSVFIGHDIYGVGHMGHNTLEKRSHKVFNLDQQIQHKISFLESIVDAEHNAKFILIGHSIGAYMCLKVMEKAPRIRVVRSLLLFPTIEEMAKQRSPLFSLLFLPGIRHLLAFVAQLLSIFLPTMIKLLIMQIMGIEGNAAIASTKLMNFTVVNNILYLAGTEFAQVLAVEETLIKKYLPKLVFYYGKDDHWAPLPLYHKMRERFPDARGSILLDNLDIPHAFPVTHNYQCASITASLLADTLPLVPGDSTEADETQSLAFPSSYANIDFGGMSTDAQLMSLRVGALAEHLEFRNRQLLAMHRNLVEVRQEVAHLLIQKSGHSHALSSSKSQIHTDESSTDNTEDNPHTNPTTKESGEKGKEKERQTEKDKAISEFPYFISSYLNEDDTKSELSVARTNSFEMLSGTFSESTSRNQSHTDLQMHDGSDSLANKRLLD